MLSRFHKILLDSEKKYFQFIMKKTSTKKTRSSNARTSTSTIPKEPSKLFTPIILPPPVQSLSDKKEYKVIQLENGLVACLISDSAAIQNYVESSSEEDSELESEEEESSESELETEPKSDNEVDNVPMKKVPSNEQKMAAASLSVRVGSFSDPKDVPGMAHFLEHMVFMGSAKYPKENEFDKFIKNRGGSNNAATDYETTSFEFECLEKHLGKSLDRFAQFFISPLMKKTAMSRERQAIDDEFRIACLRDDHRKEQLFCSLANDDCPLNSFSWGNLITLKENITDDKLYNAVHEFRKKHYSANRMKLAIQARLPIEQLEKYVLEYFSEIPNNSVEPDDFRKYIGRVFNSTQFSKIYYIKPQKDVCQLDLTWCLPPMLDKYRTKPHQFVSWLVGDEGKGSLLSYLKKKVWALKIYTDNGETGIEHNSMYSLFSVTIVLTTEGQEHLSDVIKAVYSYINMLKEAGPQERIFKEVQTIEDISFKFAVEEDPIDYVQLISESMQYYKSEDYITGSDLFFEYDPEGINAVLEHLLPNKMNIVLLCSDNKQNIVYDRKEKWFGTSYALKDIPEEWLEKWQKATPEPDMDVPPPNPFLTKNFSILPKIPDNPEYPELVLQNEFVELWYKKDEKFNLPKAQYNFYLISPLAVESASSLCKIEFLQSLFIVQIQEAIYPAQIAELNFETFTGDLGIVFKISGYNEKLPILARVISEHFKTLYMEMTPAMFLAIKDKLKNSYFNKLLKPSTLSKDLRLSILMDKFYTPLQKYEALSVVTYEDMKEFSMDFLKKIYVKMLIQGNVDKNTAIKVAQNFVETLDFQPLKKELIPTFKIIELPKGEKCCRVQAVSQDDTNSIVSNYYQIGNYNLKDSIILELALMIIEEPLFDILRTKEQLSYNVGCSYRDTFGVLGYSITVQPQATKYTTNFIDDRIENFIKTMNKTLKKMSEKKFNQIKRDLIKTKQCADVVLQDEISRNWSEIKNNDYVFDRFKQEIKMIETIKITDVRKFWNNINVCSEQKTYRKLSMQVVGFDNTSNESMETDVKNIPTVKFLYSEDGIEHPKEYFIADVLNFKKHLSYYPPVSRQSK